MGHHNPRRARAIEIGVGRGPTLGRLDDGRRWSVENKRKEEKEEKREKERRDSSRWRASRRVAREREGRRSDAARVAWDHRLELTTHFFAAKVCALFSRRRRDASLVIASSSSSPLSWYVPLLLIFSFAIRHFREKKRITGKVEHKSIFRRCDFFLQRSEKLKRRDGRKRSERRKRLFGKTKETLFRGNKRRFDEARGGGESFATRFRDDPPSDLTIASVRMKSWEDRSKPTDERTALFPTKVAALTDAVYSRSERIPDELD